MKNKRILVGAFIGILILLLFGCGSTPAPSASATHAGMDLDAAIREAAIQMETRIPTGTMIALVSVASPSNAFSTQVLTRLESAIVGNGKLVVVDRANLDKVREEQGFQLSGEVDDESAKSIGRLLGAGAIVTGQLTDLGDVYSLTLKAINIETATVAVSYLADLTKTTRIETLLATRDGGGSSGMSTIASPPSSSQTVSPAPRRFTVTFNANGASGMTPAAQSAQNGESITIPDVGAMVKVAGIFDGWNTNTNGNGISYAAGDTIIVNTNTQLFAQWKHDPNYVYKIGDTGPAGGIIFYDRGDSSGGWRYLEAAPVSIEGKNIIWAANGGSVRGTSTETGMGKQNTQAIMNFALQSGENMAAARYCDRLQYGGYEDWFLPSRAELGIMYLNLKMEGIGGFGNSSYWSSSESGDRNGAWAQNFGDGRQFSDGYDGYGDNSGAKRRAKSVRAIRQF